MEDILLKAKEFYTNSGNNYVLSNCYLNKLIYNCRYNDQVEHRINEVVKKMNEDFITCNISDLII